MSIATTEAVHAGLIGDGRQADEGANSPSALKRQQHSSFTSESSRGLSTLRTLNIDGEESPQ